MLFTSFYTQEELQQQPGQEEARVKIQQPASNSLYQSRIE